MGDLDLYQRNDALPHSYTLKRDEPLSQTLKPEHQQAPLAIFPCVSIARVTALSEWSGSPACHRNVDQ